jgi:diguanylate cyclase (GGDEF)-like protein
MKRPVSGMPAAWWQALWPRLERRALARHDPSSVVLFVALGWPMLALIWGLQALALWTPLADGVFHQGWLRGVHLALGALIAWLTGVAVLAWRARHQPESAPRLAAAALWPGLAGLSALCLAYGLTDTPMCMVLMAQMVFARALFSWRQVKGPMAAALGLALCVGAWMLPAGTDTSPLLAQPVYQGQGMHPWWALWVRSVFVVALLPVSLALFYFASLLARRQSELETLGRTDALTGLVNRREFMTRLTREAHRQARSGRPLSVLLADVDHFKRVNDNWGHPMGDQVLAAIGQLLRAHTREGVDTAARYGGEEFVLLLPETDLAGAEQVADKIQAQLRAQAFPAAPGEVFRVTLSAGVAQVVEGDTEQALKVADHNLYRAKQAGRDRVVGSVAFPARGSAGPS